LYYGSLSKKLSFNSLSLAIKDAYNETYVLEAIVTQQVGEDMQAAMHKSHEAGECVS